MASFLVLSLLLATVALSAVSFAHISTWICKQRAKSRHGCKEPPKFPQRDWCWGSDLTRMRKEALRDGRLKLLYLEHHRSLGETWQECVNGAIEVNTISCANLRYMYALHPSAFERAGRRGSAGRTFFGHGGILADGDEWKWNRKLIEPTFSKYEAATMPMLKTHVDRFMENVPRDGQAFDMQPLLKRLFLDLTTEFLFGEPLGMQLPERKQEAEAFLRTLDSVVLGLNKRRQSFTWASIRLWLDTAWSRDVEKVHALVDCRVNKAISRVASKKPDTKPDRYILVDELAAKIQDSIYLRFTMLQCFMPGRDSPGILTTNTLFALARRPELWTDLRKQALAIDETDLLSFSKLSSLRPLRHAILEALRMYGPGGRTRRYTAQNVILPEGGGVDGRSPLFVPKGAAITTFLPVLHRNKAFWGDDADEYKPERWDSFGNETEVGWNFKPFLAGPRTCPAKDQTMVQVTYVLLRLLRNFEAIGNRDEVLEFVEIAKLTTESQRGAQISLTPAVLAWSLWWRSSH